MIALREKIKGNLLLVLVFLAYIILAITMPTKALDSLKNSLYYIKEMLIIMPVVMLLTTLIEAWVPKKSIEGALGKNSGIKGSVFSFLLGSFSAGPVYAAFPLCKMLLDKGASISNIVIILSTWAVIKVPMLANEAKFLGPKFMMIRWVLTTISIFMMAYLTSRFVKKDSIPTNARSESTEENALVVNQQYCIGCGVCVKVAPNNFKMENKKAKPVGQNIKPDEIQAVNKAVAQCPAKAIQYR